jgi:hypothetical protein
MHRWTPKEINFLKSKIKGRSRAEMIRLFNERFGLSLSVGQINGQLRAHKLTSGIKLFYPGHPPSWKGANRTSYKPGQKPWNYMPIGSEHVNFDGVIEVKMKATPPKKYKSKHLIIWEKANGPVPKGHFIIFADGNKRNFSLSNLLMVSYREISVMNRRGLTGDTAELTKLGKMIADIKLLAADRKKSIKKRRTRQRNKGNHNKREMGK